MHKILKYLLKKVAVNAVTALSLLVFSLPLMAQHGHPMVGTWSGFMNRAQGEPLRALFSFSFSADQVISGSIIANGQRFPITSAVLDPDTWTITIDARGPNRAGATLQYRLTGKIENLDSPTERTLIGSWQEGSNGGEFSVQIN